MANDQSRKPRRNRRIWAVVILLGLGVITVWQVMRPDPGSLLARSKRRGVGVWDYLWLSDREILYTDLRVRPKSQRLLVKRDVDTEAVTTVRAFKSAQRNFMVGEMTARISPDKKTLLWVGSSYELLPLATTEQRSFPHNRAQIVGNRVLVPFIPSVAWLPDSRRWIEIQGLSRASSIVLHSPDTKATTTIPLPTGVGDQEVLGVTPKNQAIISRRRGALLDVLILVDLNANPALVRTLPTVAPPNADIEEMVLSPQGDRIAWKTNTWHDLQSAVSEFMSGLKGTGQRGRVTGYAIWVSRLDGTEMKQLGMERLPNSGFGFEHLRWLPDGKSVSFVYKNGLYTVPAE